ncbi:MAG: potassium channel protein [Candidatus Schekmanbacteria bacterium]|nr:MAG: potassium channel protein [Candidatus Schekmanbacteria bacterium]
MNKKKEIFFIKYLNSRGKKYAFSLVALIFFYTIIFRIIYPLFEKKEIGIIRSFEFIIESMTTTGFGGLMPFHHPITNIFAVIVMISGVVMIFMVIPLFLVPWIESKMRSEPIKEVEETLENHVIICGYSEIVDFLVEELEINSIPYVVIDANPEICLSLNDKGIRSIHGIPGSVQALKNAGIKRAKYLLVTSKDEENANIILTAKGISDIDIIALVEEPDNAKYLQYAGAKKVACPKHELGERMAYRTFIPIVRELYSALHIPSNLKVTEILVPEDSHITNLSLVESGIGKESGAKIIGIWKEGKFTTELTSDTTLEPNSILFAIGTKKEILNLKNLLLSEENIGKEHNINLIIIGYGHVGKEIYKYLDHMPENVTIIDKKEINLKNALTGNATDDTLLKKAGIEKNCAVLIALNDDTQALYTTLLARNLNPNAYIITRCNNISNIDKFYKAGANYVLALPMIAGLMLANIITDKGRLEFDRLGIERFSVKGSVSSEKTIKELDVRKKTGCTIIGIERRGETILEFNTDFKILEDDIIIVVGTNNSLEKLKKEYQLVPSQ